MRSLLLVLSHRRFLGRLAVRLPFTRPMVARFIAGESLDEAMPAIRRLHDAGFRSTVDILGESVMSEEAAPGRRERPTSIPCGRWPTTTSTSTSA